MLMIQLKRTASTMSHRLALPRHSFHVIALDGNGVPTSRDVPVLDLSPGERVDAVVKMNAPGVEYADQHGPPHWLPPPLFTRDYTAFYGTGGSRWCSKSLRSITGRSTENRIPIRIC